MECRFAADATPRDDTDGPPARDRAYRLPFRFELLAPIDLAIDGDTPMTIRMSSLLVTLLALAGLTACASTGTSERVRTSTCRPGAAATLVGRAAPDDDTVRRRTHSTLVRRIAPGDATTRDFREERVTVTVAEGQVVSASCG